jgi:hypothetical protein
MDPKSITSEHIELISEKYPTLVGWIISTLDPNKWINKNIYQTVNKNIIIEQLIDRLEEKYLLKIPVNYILVSYVEVECLIRRCIKHWHAPRTYRSGLLLFVNFLQNTNLVDFDRNRWILNLFDHCASCSLSWIDIYSIYKNTLKFFDFSIKYPLWFTLSEQHIVKIWNHIEIFEELLDEDEEFIYNCLIPFCKMYHPNFVIKFSKTKNKIQLAKFLLDHMYNLGNTSIFDDEITQKLASHENSEIRRLLKYAPTSFNDRNLFQIIYKYISSLPIVF